MFIDACNGKMQHLGLSEVYLHWPSINIAIQCAWVKVEIPHRLFSLWGLDALYYGKIFKGPCEQARCSGDLIAYCAVMRKILL